MQAAEADKIQYAGFWLRLAAMLIDTLLLVVIIVPLLWWIYGPDYFLQESDSMFAGTADVLISYVLPAIATIIFWKARQATPGKMLLSMKIVDAETGGAMTGRQAVGRYFAYLVSMLGLGLGFVWIAFDKRKQAWHDKLAGTVVVERTGKR